MIGKKLPVFVEGYHPETQMLMVGRHYGQCPDIDGQVIINDGRKDVSHTREPYNQPEALNAMTRVREFMERLAECLQEPSSQKNFRFLSVESLAFPDVQSGAPLYVLD